jgi:hypothetical protein
MTPAPIVRCLAEELATLSTRRAVFFGSALLSLFAVSFVRTPLLQFPLSRGVPVTAHDFPVPGSSTLAVLYVSPTLLEPASWIPHLLFGVLTLWPLLLRRSLATTAVATLLMCVPMIRYLLFDYSTEDDWGLFFISFWVLYWLCVVTVHGFRALDIREDSLKGVVMGLIPHGVLALFALLTKFLGMGAIVAYLLLWLFAWIAPLLSLILLWRGCRLRLASTASA